MDNITDERTPDRVDPTPAVPTPDIEISQFERFAKTMLTNLERLQGGV